MTWILPPTERFESPNRNRRWVGPDVLVLHYAVDGDDTPDGDPDLDLSFAHREPSHDCMDVARLFARKSRRASAHFVVGRDGSKVQCVRVDDTAWHAGGGAFPVEGTGPLEKPRRREMNKRSIGIEICNAGWAVEKLRIPDDRRVSATHAAMPRRTMEWEQYRPVQYDTLRYLAGQLRAATPSLRFVCGHEDVVNRDAKGRPGGKVDPGPAFDWDAIDWAALGYQRVRYDFAAKAWV